MPRLVAIDRSDVAPLRISTRLRGQLPYFAADPRDWGIEQAPPEEVFFSQQRLLEVLDAGIFEVVSPLDTANQTEIELTEEQELLLQWLTTHGVERARIAED